MTPQETIDRLEIQDLLTRYCHAVDRHDWHEFERLFAANATLDYGLRRPGRQPCGDFRLSGTSDVGDTRHAAHDLDVAADRRRRRRDRANGRPAMMITIDDAAAIACASSLWYRDLLVRTECGWRIQRRTQERSWMHDAPPVAVR